MLRISNTNYLQIDRGEITMAKNANKLWSPGQVTQLRSLARGNTPTRVIGLKMGRSEGSIQSEASKVGISLKPTNQLPYGKK